MPHEAMTQDKLKFYLEQVGAASQRSRLVFYLIMISTVMAFAFDWKNMHGGWLHSRIQLRQGILDNWNELKPGEHPGQVVTDVYTLHRYRKALELLHMESQTEPDKQSLEWQLKELEDQWYTTFKVPFMDITFDDNDFLFFSALELSILEIVFLHCLMREEETLLFSFNTFRDYGLDSLREFYNLASMKQIWTVPKGSSQWTENVLRSSAVWSFFLPVLIIWGILIREKVTEQLTDYHPQFVLNWIFAIVMPLLELLTATFLTAVTLWAWRFFRRMDDLWDDINREILPKVESTGLTSIETHQITGD